MKLETISDLKSFDKDVIDLLYKWTNVNKQEIKETYKKSFLYTSLCDMLGIQKKDGEKINYLEYGIKQVDIIKKINDLVFDIEQIKQKIKF